MYGVGTDTLVVVDGAGAPTGVRHAVANDGLMLCRPLRPRYSWPAVVWDLEALDGDTCEACFDVATAPPTPAYPEEAAAFVPAQGEAALESLEW